MWRQRRVWRQRRNTAFRLRFGRDSVYNTNAVCAKVELVNIAEHVAEGNLGYRSGTQLW